MCNSNFTNSVYTLYSTVYNLVSNLNYRAVGRKLVSVNVKLPGFGKRGHGPIEVISQHLSRGSTRKITTNLSQEVRCPGLDSS
jgi:hypothetical protein